MVTKLLSTWTLNMDGLINITLIGHFSLVHERFASPEHIMEKNVSVEEWKKQLENLLKVHKMMLNSFS